MSDRGAKGLLSVLLANMSAVEPDLAHGAIVTIDSSRVRVRQLPIEPTSG